MRLKEKPSSNTFLKNFTIPISTVGEMFLKSAISEDAKIHHITFIDNLITIFSTSSSFIRACRFPVDKVQKKTDIKNGEFSNMESSHFVSTGRSHRNISKRCYLSLERGMYLRGCIKLPHPREHITKNVF